TTLLLASTSVIAIISGRHEVLFVSIVAITMGAGTLIPWDPWWQAYIDGLGVLCYLVLSVVAPEPDANVFIHWLGIATGIALAQSNVRLQANHRKEIADQIAALEMSHQKLSDEITLREQIASEREIAQAQIADRDAMMRLMYDSSLDS